MFYLAVVSACLLLLSLIALALSLRGRLTGSHPHCRRCNFDLHNRPQDSTRCPECGADTIPPRAIRIGIRVRRRRPLLISAFAAALALISTAATTTLLLRSAGIWPQIPGLPLAYLATSGTAQWNRDALQEVENRRAANRISRYALLLATDRLLDRQANLSQKWDYAQGNVLEFWFMFDDFADDRFPRFARQIVPFAAKTRPSHRPGDPLLLELCAPVRASVNLQSTAVVLDFSATAGPQNRPLRLARSHFGPSRISSRGVDQQIRCSLAVADDDVLRSLPPGEVTLHLDLRTTFYKTVLKNLNWVSPPPGTPPATTSQTRYDLTFLQLPADGESVHPLRDPALVAAVQRAFASAKKPVLTRHPGQPSVLTISLPGFSVPSPLSYEVRLRRRKGDASATDVILGNACSSSSTSYGSHFGYNVAAEDIDPTLQTFDLAFIPSRAGALLSATQDTYADAPFTFENLPVAAPPTTSSSRPR